MTMTPTPIMHAVVVNAGTASPLIVAALSPELAQAEAERAWVEREGPFVDEEARQSWLAGIKHTTVQGDYDSLLRMLRDACRPPTSMGCQGPKFTDLTRQKDTPCP